MDLACELKYHSEMSTQYWQIFALSNRIVQFKIRKNVIARAMFGFLAAWNDISNCIPCENRCNFVENKLRTIILYSYSLIRIESNILNRMKITASGLDHFVGFFTQAVYSVSKKDATPGRLQKAASCQPPRVSAVNISSTHQGGNDWWELDFASWSGYFRW